MAREPLIDLASIDLEALAFNREAIRTEILQRYEMEQLDGVILLDLENGVSVGYKDVRDDEFWIRGHIPGRPLLPGVMIIETAAQLCSFHFKKLYPASDRFLGFAGIEGVRFRGPVVPGDRLLIVAKGVDVRRRRAIFDTQALVQGNIVYEGQIIGMPL